MEIRLRRQRRITLLLATQLLIQAFAAAPSRAQPPATQPTPPLSLVGLSNPVWNPPFNVRDPSVFRYDGGYQIYFSRLAGNWQSPKSWRIGYVFTRDFKTFTDDHDIRPGGFASPGDLIWWGGRYVLPFQRYPAPPVELCYEESADARHWSAPVDFLTDATKLPWNAAHRVIDPTLVIDGDTLHCFFVGTAVVNGVRANLIGHAVTQDPKLQTWKILTPDAPLIGTSARASDGAENLMVFKIAAGWEMIFSEGLAHQHLAYATSPDLITWTVVGPIELPKQLWMIAKYGAPYVWPDGDGWMMILMGTDAKNHTSFGLLRSTDGVKWTLLPERDSKGD